MLLITSLIISILLYYYMYIADSYNHFMQSMPALELCVSLCDVGLEHVDDCRVFVTNGSIQGRESIGCNVKNISI